MKMKKETKPEEKLTLGEQCYVLLHDLVYILAIVTLIFVFALRVVSVEGDSMYPTLVHTDRMALLSNVLLNEENLDQGDVIVAIAPNFSDDPIVKRVIATPGQTVDIDFDRGIVYVDGVALEEDYINELTTRQFYDRGTKLPLTVDEGHVFVLGDNRNQSSDSRVADIGQIDMENILGKVVFILLPGYDEQTDRTDFSRFGLVN